MCGSSPVFVIDDDEGARKSLCLALETSGFSTKAYAAAEAFLRDVTPQTRGCIILDLRLEGMTGLELLRCLRDRRIELPVIMITGHGDVHSAVSSMKLGAVDFLEKPVDPQSLVSLMRAVCGNYEQRQLQDSQRVDARKRVRDLTPRELEILQLLAAGRSSKQVAAELSISLNTVENHRAHLLNKTGSGNIAELIHLAGLAQKV